MTESAERRRIRRERGKDWLFCCPLLQGIVLPLEKGVFDLSKGFRKEGETSGIMVKVHGSFKAYLHF